MSKALPALLFMIACITCNAQDKERTLDSLLSELPRHAYEDTVRLSLLNNIAYICQCTNQFSLGIQYADKAIALAKTLHDDEKLAKAYCYKGMNYAIAGMYPSEALDMYNTAIRILEHAQLYNQEPSIYNAMGLLYTNLALYENAMDCFYKALNIFEKQNNNEGMAAVYCNISGIQNSLHNDADALEKQDTAFTFYRQSGNKFGMATALGSEGNSYKNMGNQTRAMQCYEQALHLSEETGNKESIGRSLTNIGAIYNAQNNQIKALEYYQRAMPFLQSDDKAHLYSEVAALYAKAPAATPANRFDIVFRYLDSALTLAKKNNNISLQATVWQQFSELYKSHNDYSFALYAFNNYSTLKDSINNSNSKQQSTRAEMRYQFDKKQALSVAQLQQQRIITASLLSGAGFLVITGFSGFVLYKRNRDIKTQKKDAELKAQITETEMKALRAQMNPHFIFNALNSIADYIDKQENKTASAFTGKFARLMRMVLENSERKEIPIADDIKALELYMQLECLRMNNKFTYAIDIDEAIDRENTLIPPLILQPFVENSIWHGIAKKEGKGQIIIRIQKEEDMINCIVEDDGAGIQESAIKNNGKTSMGMRITKARIDMLNKQKNTYATVQVFSKDEGVRAEVKLPLQLSF